MNNTPFSQKNGTDVLTEYDLAKNKRGENWTKNNVNTLIIWLNMAMHQIKTLDMAIQHYRCIIRRNIIAGLILSTASGTISATNIVSTTENLQLTLNIIFTILTFIIALASGYLKVYQIQENLEQFIKVKQGWVVFSIELMAELHLPIKLRNNALFLIDRNKDKYLEILKCDLNIPEKIRNESYSLIKNMWTTENYHDPENKNKSILSNNDLPSILKDTIFKLNLEFQFLCQNEQLSENAEEKISNIINNGIGSLLTYKPEEKTISTNEQPRMSTLEKFRTKSQSKLAITKPNSSKNNLTFEENEIIEADYRRMGKWYQGTIVRIAGPDKYDIKYNDGEYENAVSNDLIRKYIKVFNIGDQIEANYHNSGKWYIGTIIGKGPNETYNIDFENGYNEQRVNKKLIRLYKQPELIKFNKGDRIEGNFHGENIWYRVTIDAIFARNIDVNSVTTNTYNINYDDNRTESMVSESCIRPINYCELDTELEIGDLVDAKYKKIRAWLPGKIINKKSDNIYDIQYNDNIIDTDLTREYIKKYKTIKEKIPIIEPIESTESHVIVESKAIKTDNEMTNKNKPNKGPNKRQ